MRPCPSPLPCSVRGRHHLLAGLPTTSMHLMKFAKEKSGGPGDPRGLWERSLLRERGLSWRAGVSPGGAGSPALIFVLFLSLRGSSRGILVVFETSGPLMCTFGVLRLSCESLAVSASHDNQRTRNAHIFRAPALQTPPKFHEKTPPKREEKEEIVAEREILGGHAEGCPALGGQSGGGWSEGRLGGREGGFDFQLFGKNVSSLKLNLKLWGAVCVWVGVWRVGGGVAEGKSKGDG